MTARDWRIMKEDFDIRVRGGKAPLPLRKWSEAALPPPVARAIAEMGFEQPSPIQRQAIPVGLQRSVRRAAPRALGDDAEPLLRARARALSLSFPGAT